MGGRGASSGIKRGKASNTKYNGFSVTDKNGKTSHYVVIGGKVAHPTTEGTRGSLTREFDSNDPFQKAYDRLGSVDAVIKQINKVGKGKASILSDKAVEKMAADYAEKQKNRKVDPEVRSSKKGVNRHRAFWSAM